MAHEETIYRLMKQLVIASKREIGDIMACKGVWTVGTSTVNNSYKALCALADIGKVVKSNGYFKLPSCKSEYAEHAQLLTKSLAELFKLPEINPVIFREHTTPVGLRSDAICLITKDNQGLCLILEVMINEPERYLKMKQNTWENWPEATQHLSQLFNYKIPHFEIVPITVLDGFISFLQEVV